MRNKLLVSNWKMNKSYDAAKSLLNELNKVIEEKISKDSYFSDIEIVIATPFTYLIYNTQRSFLKTAAQNCFFEEWGAFTGEISVPMLKSIGVEYIIVGHSERRKYFNETDEIIGKKISKILEHGIKPIVCCGEPWNIRKSSEHIQFIKTQLNNIFDNIEDESYIKNIIVAYEPIWAIGTNTIPTLDEIEEMHKNIRIFLGNRYSQDLSKKIQIIYGGNLNSNNAKGIFLCNNVDGGLIGRASLNTESFIDILNCMKNES